MKYRYFTVLKYSDVHGRVETLIATSLKLRVVVPSPLLILVIRVSSVQLDLHLFSMFCQRI